MLSVMLALGFATSAVPAGATTFSDAYARARAGAATPEDLRLLALGAGAGDAEAAYDLASLFETGHSVRQDPRRAFEWFWQAMVSGSPGALERLRKAYANLNSADQARISPDVRHVLFPHERLATLPALRSPAPPGAALPTKPREAQILGIAAEVVKATRNTRVPPALALAVATVESRFQPAAESPKGARGVMQIMPATASSEFALEPDALWDVRTNVVLGVRFLDQLIGRYGAIQPALAHYVGGGRAVGWLQTGQAPDVSAYVAHVMDYYQFYRRRGF